MLTNLKKCRHIVGRVSHTGRENQLCIAEIVDSYTGTAGLRPKPHQRYLWYVPYVQLKERTDVKNQTILFVRHAC